MNTFFDTKNAARMGKILLLAGVFAVLLLMTKFLNETKKFNGADKSVDQVSTIDVSGEGFAFAIPNIASESFSVSAKAATVQSAQGAVSVKINDIVSFLKKSGVEEKDIQTTNYSANPEYSYPTPCYGQTCPVSSNTPKLLGYTVSETITVKIRNTENLGKIIDGLGSRGVTDMNGPIFTVDNADTVTQEARAKAIVDAKTKAAILARDLGVKLVRVVHFSENNGGSYPVPMYAKDMMVGASSSSSQLPAGQNKYTSNVTITYEIQ